MDLWPDKLRTGEWEAPWGVKGAMELGAEMPFWLALPAGAGLKAWRSVAEAPLIEKLLVRGAVAPLAAMEKAPGIVLKPVKKIAPAIPIPVVLEINPADAAVVAAFVA